MAKYLEIIEELRILIKDHQGTKRMVGGLSNVVGYQLEDLSYKHLPYLLKQDFNTVVKGKLTRKNIIYPDRNFDEVNIFGIGHINGDEVHIVGECKTQLSKKAINNFLELLKRLETKLGYKRIISFFVTYQTDPVVEDYLKKKNLKVYYSYDFNSPLPSLQK